MLHLYVMALGPKDRSITYSTVADLNYAHVEYGQLSEEGHLQQEIVYAIAVWAK